MWMVECDSIPLSLFEKSRAPGSRTDQNALRSRSHRLYAVGAGRELMFVLGILPPTMLSREAFFWMTVMRGVEFTRAQARTLAKVFPALIRQLPWEMRAEVFTEDTRGVRFVQFLGAVPLWEIGDRTIYGWSG